MRKNGLTTAKMIAIMAYFVGSRADEYRRTHYNNVRDGIQENPPYDFSRFCRNLRDGTEKFEKIVELGISREEFVQGLQELGYEDVDNRVNSNGSLRGYETRHEGVFPDTAKEDHSDEEDDERLIESKAKQESAA